jgi:hypothetical protein
MTTREAMASRVRCHGTECFPFPLLYRTQESAPARLDGDHKVHGPGVSALLANVARERIHAVQFADGHTTYTGKA